VPKSFQSLLNWIVESGLYVLLRFEKEAVRGNYETGNQAFSMPLRFLTTRDLLVSPQLDTAVLTAWGIPTRKNVGTFNEKQAEFLKFHRDVIFGK